MESPCEATVGRGALIPAVVGGATTALAGVVGYLLPPLRATDYGDGMNATFEVLRYFVRRSIPYHAAVLVFVPFVTTVVLLSADRRWGVTGAEAEANSDLTVGLGIVSGPVVTVVVAAVTAVAATGATNGVGVMAYAFVFGLGITTVLLSIVFAAETASVLAGYALVRGVRWVRRRRT
ncbi:hypothetical protein [Halopelagius longus]|uniref:Uncharacterized protein n=1 Tax=Halopelagius longus TaxID=1236180 RepID=A0A1H1DY77_9EURY|nr:hypothetical protein [Halopelagius longus]RDI71516.1 hypothetical protein DWB78_07155 [Halopelagius longus]SDQ81209.1 hypothetical protein SAMN05216278_2634 [Halopelagius longus]